MARRVIQAAIGLLVLAATACTTVESGTPVAASAGSAARTTTAPVPATTAPTTETTTPTPETTVAIPKPQSPQTIQVKVGSNVPMRGAYQMAYVQVLTIEGGEVAIIADWAPGSGGDFACYNNCSLSAGDVVSISGMGPGSVVSLNNLVLVVDKVSGSRAQFTVGTLH